MKITTRELSKILPFSGHSFRRLVQNHNFPKPEKSGRTYYYQLTDVIRWLDEHASIKGRIKQGDELVSTRSVTELTGRSYAWVSAKVVTDASMCKLNISPSGKGSNPHNYFIKREIESKYSLLCEIARGEVLA